MLFQPHVFICVLLATIVALTYSGAAERRRAFTSFLDAVARKDYSVASLRSEERGGDYGPPVVYDTVEGVAGGRRFTLVACTTGKGTRVYELRLAQHTSLFGDWSYGHGCLGWERDIPKLASVFGPMRYKSVHGIAPSSPPA